jgi:hypothetical protein
MGSKSRKTRDRDHIAAEKVAAVVRLCDLLGTMAYVSIYTPEW